MGAGGTPEGVDEPALRVALDAEVLAATGDSEAAGERGGGAAQPVSPGDAGGAPPTTKTVARSAYG